MIIQIRLRIWLWIIFRLSLRAPSSRILTVQMKSLPKSAGIWLRIYTVILFPNMLPAGFSVSWIPLSATVSGCFMLLQSVLLRKVNETAILWVQEVRSVLLLRRISAEYQRLIRLHRIITAKSAGTANFSCTVNTVQVLTCRQRTAPNAARL